MRYAPPQSNKQIRTIINSGIYDVIARLMRMIAGTYRERARTAWIRPVCTMLQRAPLDAAIWKTVRNTVHTGSGYAREEFSTVVRNYADILHPHINARASYLDVGAGTGIKTLHLGQQLGFAEIAGTDITDWQPLDSAERTQEITWRLLENDIPWPEASHDLVTCFMTLHHIADAAHMIAEMLRVLRPGGVLVIREHDVRTAADRMLVDIEHNLYDAMQHREPLNEHLHCKSRAQWHELIAPHAELLVADYDMIGVSPQVHPTRGFHAVYKKN